MFYFVATLPKEDDIRRGICFAFSCISSIQFKSEIPLFRPRIAVNAISFSSLLPRHPGFQSIIPLISLVSNQLFASSKSGKCQLVMKN